jgi:hypothetical protein
MSAESKALAVSDEAHGSVQANLLSRTLPSKATEIDDAGIVRVNSYFEQECPTPRVIDVEPSAAIHPANIPESAIAQDSLSIPARDGAPVVEAGAYINFHRDSMSGRW